MANSGKLGLTAVATPALTDTFSVRQSGDARDKKETLAQARSVVAPDATTAAKGLVELATDGENAAAVVVQGNDARLSNSRPPSGAAGGDLSGAYPNPSVADDSHSHTAATLPASAVPLVSFLAASLSNSTTSMAATGLSIPVLAGHRYTFVAELRFDDSSGGFTDAAKVDFDGSTAVAADFCAFCHSGSSVWNPGATFSTALATDFEATTFGGPSDWVVIRGSLEVSANGTFAVRFAQSVHIDGTLTLRRGSSLIAVDMT